MKEVTFSLGIAAVLWFVMFSPWTAPLVNFWYTMAFSAGALTALSAIFCPQLFRQIQFSWKAVAVGAGLAVVLWGIFWVGNRLSVRMFDFARPQVASIYGMKTGESPVILACLLFFLIGPAEEIFWRGYVQRTFSAKWNPAAGYLVTTFLYAAVHIWAFNFMLFMAALVVGGVWGLVYRFYPRNLLPLMVSHALWDVAIFVVFPV